MVLGFGNREKSGPRRRCRNMGAQGLKVGKKPILLFDNELSFDISKK